MMFFESTAAPGETHVARACIAGPIDREPEFHIFIDQKVDWANGERRTPEAHERRPGVGGI
jgi:hypothetical protein